MNTHNLGLSARDPQTDQGAPTVARARVAPSARHAAPRRRSGWLLVSAVGCATLAMLASIGSAPALGAQALTAPGAPAPVDKRPGASPKPTPATVSKPTQLDSPPDTAVPAPNLPPMFVAKVDATSADGYRVRWDPSKTASVELMDVSAAAGGGGGGGRVLFSGLVHALVYPSPLTTRVHVEAQARGFDVVCDVLNTTGAAQELPSINLSRVLMGTITAWNFSHGHHSVVVRPPAARTRVLNAIYPNEWYAPVMVFGDDRHTIGVSVLYDAVGYDQSVRPALEGSPAGEPLNVSDARAGWDVWIGPQGTIEPGQGRTYRVCVRVARAGDPAGWMGTLEPYRTFFREVYGGASYSRDGRPIAGHVLAQDRDLGNNNTRGFSNFDRRPDVVGFGPAAAQIDTVTRGRGYQRLMIWAVSGLYNRERAFNYPGQLFSGMLDSRAMSGSIDRLRDLGNGPFQVGYWWGNVWSVRQRWDEAPAMTLDPDNPEHVRLAMRELDTAFELGATLVGLDAFPVSTPGRQYRLLAALHQRAPQVKFVTELACADIYHTMAATWINADDITGPQVLADLLVPGHETWAGVRYDVIEHRTGKKLTMADRVAELRRLAQLGFTPVDLYGVSLAQPLLAATTWPQTVPKVLRLPPAPARVGYDPKVAVPGPSSLLTQLRRAGAGWQAPATTP